MAETKDQDRPLFSIGVMARMVELHPQTLRLYEREGLIIPCRTKGRTRLYSFNDVERLRVILYLTQDQGINLAGVGALLEIQDQFHTLQGEIWETLQLLQGSLQRQKPRPVKEVPGSQDRKDRPHSRKNIRINIEEG